MARQAAVQSGESWTEEEIESLVRSGQGVVGWMVARTDDMTQARAAMGRALVWRDHLFAAGAYDPAGEIVTAVWLVLDRWGRRDHAKALLTESIATLEDALGKAAAQSNLATLLKNEGKMAEALATYEAAYSTFEAMGAGQQMAAVLNVQSQVLRAVGRYNEAMERQEASLAMKRDLSDEEGQAISLYQLSVLHMLKKDYADALARSQEAEALNRSLSREVGVASCLHAQGLVFTLQARSAADDAEAERQRGAAFDRFTESQAISRRIGNEAGAADSLAELGKLLMDAGRMREAIDAFNEFVETQQRLNSPAKLGMGLECLGAVHERQGQLAAALEKYQQALELYQQYAPPEVERCKRNIALVREKMGNG